MRRQDSRLLLHEEPLQVLPSLASKLGINEAILLQQVHYWLKHAEKAQEERKHKDDRWWTYNTYNDWQRQMPWLSVAGVRKLVYKLEKAGLLLSTDEYNERKADQTKWYTIHYEAVDALASESSAEAESESGESEGAETESEGADPEGVPESSSEGDTEGHPPDTEGHGGVPESSSAGVPQSSRPLPENPESLSENSPRGTGFPAKALTTLTIDRAREAGFDPARHQIANWGRGWSEFAYVASEAGQKPPDAEDQFAVLAEIVAAAAGNRGKGRYFLSVKDAARRVRDTGKARTSSRSTAPEIAGEEGAARRKEGYEWLFDREPDETDSEETVSSGRRTREERREAERQQWAEEELERTRRLKVVEQHLKQWRSEMDDKGYQLQVGRLKRAADENGITVEDVERLDEEIRAEHAQRKAG